MATDDYQCFDRRERHRAGRGGLPVETALNTALADAGVEPGADMVASIAALAAALTEAKEDLDMVVKETTAESSCMLRPKESWNTPIERKESMRRLNW